MNILKNKIDCILKKGNLSYCKIAKLIDGKKKSVHTNSFKEFLIYGLKYVFPSEPGAFVRGIPTAHSAPPIAVVVNSFHPVAFGIFF